MPKPASTVAQPSQKDAEAQLKSFIDKFEPAHRTLIRAVRKGLRARFPTAYEMAYDNYNFFVIGYSPTERPSDAIVSLVAGSNGVGICFIQGARLPDPKKVLRGAGNQTRSVHLESAADVQGADMQALFSAAVEESDVPFRERGDNTLIIRSISAKQRPRRK